MRIIGARDPKVRTQANLTRSYAFGAGIVNDCVTTPKRVNKLVGWKNCCSCCFLLFGFGTEFRNLNTCVCASVFSSPSLPSHWVHCTKNLINKFNGRRASNCKIYQFGTWCENSGHVRVVNMSAPSAGQLLTGHVNESATSVLLILFQVMADRFLVKGWCRNYQVRQIENRKSNLRLQRCTTSSIGNLFALRCNMSTGTEWL